MESQRQQHGHGSKYFARRASSNHPLTLEIWSKCQKSTFSHHFLVAYSIKEDQFCSKMVANILQVEPLPPKIVSEYGHVAY